MRRLHQFLPVLAAVTLVTVACDKDDDDDPQASSQQFADPVGGITDGAVLVNARTYAAPPVSAPGVPSVDVQLDLPIALFYDGGSTTVAGTVVVDGEQLAERGGTYSGGTTPQPGQQTFAFTNRDWTVEGAGEVPPLSVSASRQLPSVGALDIPESLTRGESFTLAVASVSGADSVIFNLGGVVKTVPGNTRSVTFTADETERAEGNPTVAQVAPYNIERPAGPGGYAVYMVNEAVRTRFIEVE